MLMMTASEIHSSGPMRPAPAVGAGSTTKTETESMAVLDSQFPKLWGTHRRGIGTNPPVFDPEPRRTFTEV